MSDEDPDRDVHHEHAEPDQPTVAIDRPDFLKHRTGEPVPEDEAVRDRR